MSSETDRAIMEQLRKHEEADRSRHEQATQRLVRIETLVGAQADRADDHEGRIRTLEGAKQRAAGAKAAKAALYGAAAAGGGGVAGLAQWLMSMSS